VGIVRYVGEMIEQYQGSHIYNVKAGYPPMFSDWDSFWTRKMYRKISDCWHRPVVSCASSYISVAERISVDSNESFQLTGQEIHCLNLGSYNYLGFSDTSGKVMEDVVTTIRQTGVSVASTGHDLGLSESVAVLEKMTAKFLDKDDCVVVGMGYATNASVIPSVVGKGSLIISDSLNHASVVHGCRTSGAKIKPFMHNDLNHLESIIRDSIVKGQPRTHRPWDKILIIVEGIYSMEGEMCDLKEIVRIKKKYKCYLWIDEAHSIGALGKTGRGICEHAGVPTSEVDILMGTFTKSFASVGGYIAGSKELIGLIRRSNFASLYSTNMSTAAAQQVIGAMRVITGEDGTDLGQKKLQALKDNSNFFRKGLIERGFQVYGEKDSPVVPVMIYYPCKLMAFSRACLERGIAVVIVGFPATSLLMSRVRFCISAAHTIEDLQWALDELNEIGEILMIKDEEGNDFLTSEERFKLSTHPLIVDDKERKTANSQRTAILLVKVKKANSLRKDDVVLRKELQKEEDDNTVAYQVLNDRDESVRLAIEHLILAKEYNSDTPQGKKEIEGEIKRLQGEIEKLRKNQAEKNRERRTYQNTSIIQKTKLDNLYKSLIKKKNLLTVLKLMATSDNDGDMITGVRKDKDGKFIELTVERLSSAKYLNLEISD